jgi:hypothetical protein
MFLTTVARPRYNAEGECTFDGKIGIWPFLERVRHREVLLIVQLAPGKQNQLV